LLRNLRKVRGSTFDLPWHPVFATVAVVGQQQTTKTMKDTVQLTQPQRKALVDMIAIGYNCDIWDRARKKYDETRDSLKGVFVREMATKIDGTKELIQSILDLRMHVRKAEQHRESTKVDLDASEYKLKAVGFYISGDGEPTISSWAPESLKLSIDKKVDKELGTKEQVLTVPFETARLKLLTVATAEEAAKIVEPLLNFEVKAK
jgi:hypothetical protein